MLPGPKKKSNPPGKPNCNDESGTVTLVLVLIFTTQAATRLAISAIVCSPSGVSPMRGNAGTTGTTLGLADGTGTLPATLLPGHNSCPAQNASMTITTTPMRIASGGMDLRRGGDTT